VQWECGFELTDDKEEVERMSLRTRDALYRGCTKAMRLHYRAKEAEKTIRYVDVMSLYACVYKYFKFPIGHPTIHLD
jgi:hypothetical protein